MRFFKRGAESDPPADFWGWWSSDGRVRVAEAITTGDMNERLIDAITRAVSTLHPAMAWSLAPGRVAEHAFCLSPEGDAEVRQAALRWLDIAPPPDAMWEYHASKLASTTPMDLAIGGRNFDLGEMRAITSWDATRRRVDVRLWHPSFAEVPEDIRLQVGFLSLDDLLGEDDAERWIGHIDLLEAPTGGRTPAELRAEVERRAAEPAGEGTWILTEFTGPDGQVEIVLADAALKRIDHPFADQHVEITAVLEGPNGLPDDADGVRLNAEEDDLIERLGAVAVYAGRTTAPGRRTMHFAAEDLDRVRAVIDAWAEPLQPRRIKVNFEPDMDWSFQQELGAR